MNYRVVFSDHFGEFVVRDPSGNIIYMGERSRCEKYLDRVIDYLKSPFA